jgi:hypothetical protein
MRSMESGGEPHALQTLARLIDAHETREAFGLRVLQHRFSDFARKS